MSDDSETTSGGTTEWDGMRVERRRAIRELTEEVSRLGVALAACQRELSETNGLVGRQTAKLSSAVADKVRADAEVARLRTVWDNWTRENLALAEVARVQAMGPLSPSNFSPEAVDPLGEESGT